MSGDRQADRNIVNHDDMRKGRAVQCILGRALGQGRGLNWKTGWNRDPDWSAPLGVDRMSELV